MQEIHIVTRAEGQDGYQVGWQPFNGTSAIGPPVYLAHFEMTTQGRREAMLFKNGLKQGMRLAGDIITRMVLD